MFNLLKLENNKTFCFQYAIYVFTDCGELTPPANGAVNTDHGTKFQAEATYVCDQGYKLVGNVQRQCLETGEWGGLKPSCHEEGKWWHQLRHVFVV